MGIFDSVCIYLLYLAFELCNIYCHDQLPHCGSGSSFTFSPSTNDLDENYFGARIYSADSYYKNVIVPYSLYRFKRDEIEKSVSWDYVISEFAPLFCVLLSLLRSLSRVGVSWFPITVSCVLCFGSSFIMRRLYKRSSWSLPAFENKEFTSLNETLRENLHNREFDDGILVRARINNQMNKIHSDYIDSVYYRVMRRVYIRLKFEFIYFFVFLFISISLEG